MDLYNLGTVSWRDSQGLYHALAHLGREGLFLLQPGQPYVCVGYHQDARKEVDVDFLQSADIPLVRREVGGGAVYLDTGQLFYQLILDPSRDDVPYVKDAFYRRFLEPVVQTFRDFGVEASFKPVNDIIVDGRKISGNGAAEINGMMVLVGNFMLNFNYDMMVKSLRVPSEKFRDKVHKTMYDSLTTMTRVLGETPDMEALSARLVERYTPLLGEFTEREVDDELRARADEMWETMLSRDEWTFGNDRRESDGRSVRIAEGTNVIQRMYKSGGGLIRATAVEKDGYLYDVHLSGDFFFFPMAELPALEAALEGVAADAAAVEARLSEFYTSKAVDSPGVTPADFAVALVEPAS